MEDFIKSKIIKLSNETEPEIFLLVKEKNLPQIIKLECTHMYHPKCLIKWLNSQPKCPTCRSEVKSDSNYIFFNIEELD